MDLSSPANCLTFNLQRAAREMTRRGDAALAPLGLSSQQFTILFHLFMADAVPVTRLAAMVGAERTTMTRNLGVLERAGLVAAAPADDARVKALVLTPRGRVAVERALPVWRDIQKAAITRLTTLAPEALLTALREM